MHLFLTEQILDVVFGIYVYTYPEVNKEDVEIHLLRPQGFQVHEIVNGVDLGDIDLGKIAKPTQCCNDVYVYIVEKINVDSIEVCELLQKMFKCLRCEVLGLKDANAVVRQVVVLRRCRRSNHAIELQLKEGYVKAVLWQCNPSAIIHNGNRFSIEVVVNNPEVIKKRLELVASCDHAFLNFFGYQRFGTRRPKTHLLGKMLIKNEWSLFIENLCDDKVKHRLMKLEDIVCKKRFQYEDMLKTIKFIPKNLIKLYVNAYQSYLFNKLLSLLWLKLLEEHGFEEAFKILLKEFKFIPVVGSELKLNMLYTYRSKLKDLLDEILNVEGISLEDFNIKTLGIEIKGDYRSTVAKAHGVRITFDRNTLRMFFTLDRGCYATMFLRELFRVNPLIYT